LVKKKNCRQITKGKGAILWFKEKKVSAMRRLKGEKECFLWGEGASNNNTEGGKGERNLSWRNGNRGQGETVVCRRRKKASEFPFAEKGREKHTNLCL